MRRYTKAAQRLDSQARPVISDIVHATYDRDTTLCGKFYGQVAHFNDHREHCTKCEDIMEGQL